MEGSLERGDLPPFPEALDLAAEFIHRAEPHGRGPDFGAVKRYETLLAKYEDFDEIQIIDRYRALNDAIYAAIARGDVKAAGDESSALYAC